MDNVKRLIAVAGLLEAIKSTTTCQLVSTDGGLDLQCGAVKQPEIAEEDKPL